MCEKPQQATRQPTSWRFAQGRFSGRSAALQPRPRPLKVAQRVLGGRRRAAPYRTHGSASNVVITAKNWLQARYPG